MSLVPVALYGLEVPCGGMPVPALPDFPATFRITMAAIDPSEPAEVDETPNGTTRPRATLKIIRQTGPFEEDDSEDEDDEDDETLQALLAQSDSEDESDEDGDEANGGPSDPTKSKKGRKQAALQQLLESIKAGGDSDEEMEDAPTNGTKADKKGKAKVTGDEEEEEGSDSSDDEEGSEIDVDEFVLCTLDPEKNYQQPLDITIGENERVFFSVTGTHTIYLTGNYVISDNDGGHNHHHEVYDSSDDEDDEDYDLSPDEDELELDVDDDESDDLDAMENPRITEVESDEEEAPKLVAKAAKASKAEKKGKNKRSADQIDESASLDDIMAKSLKSEAAVEEPKLTKKQKKLKKNNGEAAPATPATPESKGADTKEPTSAKSDKSDKKVQFAKNLEQGPTGSEAPAKGNKAALGPKTVNGVKIDDKKIGSGPIVKSGDKVGMRYIGKLADGKVFDSNKSGKPFEFKVGKKEVIQGWDIGIVGMAAGGERRLTIPPKLAYGNKALPGLPANSTLIFDVKLINIKK
ncbi:FK506-binding protein [Lachnellula occidentalis]|uniref:peptidylprolyl isomerase n=1 Tax=Lachnellula occidentalis TaxID=215460 RepID=A0A8H8UJR9_9HELO|nr:FK506-binding protein [Lachnellula occidentalis]